MQTVNIVDIIEKSGVLLGPNDVGYYKVLIKVTVTSQYVRHLTVKKVLFTVSCSNTKSRKST